MSADRRHVVYTPVSSNEENPQLMKLPTIIFLGIILIQLLVNKKPYSLVSFYCRLYRYNFYRYPILTTLFAIASLSLYAQDDSGKLTSVLGDKQEEIVPNHIKLYTRLEQTVEIFKDETGNTSFEEILANDQWFVPNSRESFEPEAIYWMKVNLKADLNFRDTCLFGIGYDGARKTWNKIDAYFVHENGRIEKQQTGNALSLHEKSIRINNSAVSFGLEPGEEARLYVRVAGGEPEEVPPLLGMWARRWNSLPPYYYSGEYQFAGKYYYSAVPGQSFQGNIIPNLEILEDPHGSITIDELLAQGKNLNWEENNLKVVPERGKVYWIKTRIRGSSVFVGEHLFHVGSFGEWETFDYVDAYIIKKGGVFSHQRTGGAVPTNERPYDFWATFFKVELQPTDTIDLYVRLEGLHRFHPMRSIWLRHIDPLSLFPESVNAAKKKMFVLGAMAMIFVFFLCLFFIEKERIHLYYSIFILAGFFIESTGEEPLYTFIAFPEIYTFYTKVNFIGMFLGAVFSVKFTETYFNYPSSSFYSKRIIPIYISLYTLSFIPLLFMTNPINEPTSVIPFYNIFNTLTIAQIPFTLWLGIKAKGQPRSLKIIFFIALTPIIIVVIARMVPLILWHLGYHSITLSPLWLRIFPYALLFLITVFALSIGYRKNLLKKEKEKALEDNLQAQQTIIEKLEETARLEKMDEVKTRFFTNITHEFRTPLTVILGMAEQLKTSATKNGISEGLTLIERNGKKLLQLINELLYLSKIDSAKLKVNYQNKEVVSFIQYLGESFESLADKKGVRLSIYSEIDELTMAVDEIKLQKIVANLMSNAIKFTPKRGKVILHLAQKGQQLHLKIKDTGEGISEAALPHIFDRFYQVDNPSSRKGEGTGIGLSLVKELVDLLDGTISVKSKAGKGTEFLVILPITKTNTPATATADKDEIAMQNFDPLFVAPEPMVARDETSGFPIPEAPVTELPQLLIVEDNPDVVAYLQSILKQHYQVQIARDGKQGIEVALEQVPDIIISDVMMPEKSGFELVEALKTDERTSHIPIVMLTAKASEEAKIQGLKTGADAYLMKPFNREELFVRLEKLLELRKVLQERYASGEFASGASSAVGTEPTLDDIFMQKIHRAIAEGMGRAEFGIDDLCQVASRSSTQVYRKMKALTGQSPVRFIQKIRLRKAKTLLQTTELNVSEIAYELGFTDPGYFSRAFGKEFGMPPSTFRK